MLNKYSYGIKKTTTKHEQIKHSNGQRNIKHFIDLYFLAPQAITSDEMSTVCMLYIYFEILMDFIHYCDVNTNFSLIDSRFNGLAFQTGK